MCARTTARLGTVTALLALGTACNGAWFDSDLVRSDLEREHQPAVSADHRAELAAGNRAFAFDLYGALAPEPGNLFFSPHSISAALAMTYAGAGGETAREMAQVLHFTLPPSELHSSFNRLDQELALRSRADPPPDLPDAEPPRLEIANALWVRRDQELVPEFLETLAVDYGAGMRVLDFAGEPEESRGKINRWVSRRTEGRIPELLPEGAISSTMRLVLTNAIYFFANWVHPFEPRATRPGTFLVDGTSAVTVDMMRQSERFGYAAGDGYAVVSLPYVGGQVSMILVVPDAGRFAEIEAQLAPELFDSIVAALENRRVVLTMPKWEFTSSFALGSTLEQLGMRSAFGLDQADFSGMVRTGEICLSEVIHQAFIAVDEAGTEAAAATAVMMVESALPAEPVTLTIDRPFLFLIHDRPTGTLLFAGRVTDPR